MVTISWFFFHSCARSTPVLERKRYAVFNRRVCISRHVAALSTDRSVVEDLSRGSRPLSNRAQYTTQEAWRHCVADHNASDQVRCT